MIKLMLGDCLEKMKEIEDKSIDMILCDLPYGITKCKWDSIINLDKLWFLYDRIIKNNGAIVLFGQDKFSAQLMLFRPTIHRYNLIWKKGDRVSGFLNAKKMPLRNHEDILVFYKKLPAYNLQLTKGKPIHSTGNKNKKHQTDNYNNFKDMRNNRAGQTLKYPKSVLNFEKPHPTIHPTQKPIALCEYLIKTYTNENDLVLDNCMGSGTTGVACVNLNRSFIGIELKEEYFKIAEQRIEEAKKAKKFSLDIK